MQCYHIVLTNIASWLRLTFWKEWFIASHSSVLANGRSALNFALYMMGLIRVHLLNVPANINLICHVWTALKEHSHGILSYFDHRQNYR